MTCYNYHWKIVAVHQAHIIKILTSAARAKGEFSKCRWWGSTGTIALDLAGATITCGTVALAIGVKIAPCSAPEAARPAGGGIEGSRS